MQSMRPEQWKPVVGYEDLYEVSDQGRVRSVRRGNLLRPMPTTNGKYLVVDLYRGGKETRKMTRVHRIVAMAFIGPPADEALTDCCHLDGDGHNNAATNLRWATHGDNLQDRIAHGTHPSATKTHCPAGHALVPGNLLAHPLRTKGHRVCKECKRQQSKSARHAENRT